MALSAKDHLSDTQTLQQKDQRRPTDMFAPNPPQSSLKQAVDFMNNRDGKTIDGHTATHTEVPTTRCGGV